MMKTVVGSSCGRDRVWMSVSNPGKAGRCPWDQRAGKQLPEFVFCPGTTDCVASTGNYIINARKPEYSDHFQDLTVK